MVQRVTVHDVARRAGVGKSTVSNVLSGRGRVSDETRMRVRAAADELGYVPNPAARHLRGGRTGMIGVYVPGVPSTSEFYMRFVFGIMERAAVEGHDTTILTATPGRALRPLDGVIVADAHRDDDFARQLLESSLPVVCFERPTGLDEADAVLWCDSRRAVVALLDHMASSGANHPALVLPPVTGDWAAQLADGYEEWCAATGVPPAVAHHPWIPMPSDVVRAVEQVLDRPAIDAVITASLDCAPMAADVLARRGRRVGRDVLLASATESSALQLTRPPVTSLDLDPSGAGRRCADLLGALLERGEGGRHTHPVLLHRRASTRGEGTVAVTDAS